MKNKVKAFVTTLMFMSTTMAGSKGGIDLNQSINKYATAPNLNYTNARVVIDNDESLRTKIEMIRKATKSIDMMYYIYADDQSASLFSQEIIKAAQRGVKVRLLLDYFMNYKNLDLLNAIISQGNGNIDIRLYGRPTESIMKDAIFMSMPCAQTMQATKCEICTDKNSGSCTREQVLAQRQCEFNSDKACSAEKVQLTNGLVSQAKASGKNMQTFVSSLQLPGVPFPVGSGEILAGLYSKNLNYALTIMGMTQALDKAALARWAQGLNNPEDTKKLKEFAKRFIEYKEGDSMGLKLYMTAKNDFETIQPVLEKFSRYLPLDVPQTDEEKAIRARDWNFITDYLHHKIILVDGKSVMVGGRNIENSYHMSVNDAKYVFMDTEIAADLKDEASQVSIIKSFSELYNFTNLVAPLSEVNQFMPNELLVNFGLGGEACEKNYPGIEDADLIVCTFGYLMKNFTPAQTRIAKVLEKMNQSAEEFRKNIADFGSSVQDSLNPKYNSDYLAAKEKNNLTDLALANVTSKNSNFKSSQGVFKIEDGQVMGYLENLPFSKWKTKQNSVTGKVIEELNDKKVRKFGAVYGFEQASGKGIHKVWIDKLLQICQDNKSGPKEVILHSAYWFPSANLLKALGKMARLYKDSKSVDEQGGDPIKDCSHVTVKIITNSVKSTDLAPVNMYANYAMYSFYQAIVNADAKTKKEMEKGAKVEYYQYANEPTKIDFMNKKFDQVFSLHTKLSLIGDDVIVGSANGDVRSFMMDTNNAIVVRNQPQFSKEYNVFINQLIQSGKIERVDQIWRAITPVQLRESTRQAMMENRFVVRYKARQIAKILKMAGLDMSEALANLKEDEKNEESNNPLIYAAKTGDLTQLNAKLNSQGQAILDAGIKELNVKLNKNFDYVLNYLDGVSRNVHLMLIYINPTRAINDLGQFIQDTKPYRKKGESLEDIKKDILNIEQAYDNLYKLI